MWLSQAQANKCNKTIKIIKAQKKTALTHFVDVIVSREIRKNNVQNNRPQHIFGTKMSDLTKWNSDASKFIFRQDEAAYFEVTTEPLHDKFAWWRMQKKKWCKHPKCTVYFRTYAQVRKQERL